MNKSQESINSFTCLFFFHFLLTYFPLENTKIRILQHLKLPKKLNLIVTNCYVDNFLLHLLWQHVISLDDEMLFFLKNLNFWHEIHPFSGVHRSSFPKDFPYIQNDWIVSFWGLLFYIKGEDNPLDVLPILNQHTQNFARDVEILSTPPL